MQYSVSKDEKFKIGIYVFVGLVLLIGYFCVSNYTVTNSQKLLSSSSILPGLFGYSKTQEFIFKRPLEIEEKALAGNAKAMVSLAKLMISGVYYWINRYPLEDKAQRFEKVITWLTKAASLGNAEAMYLLAAIYDENNHDEYQYDDIPLSHNYNAELARNWYEKASLFGYNRADLWLCKLYTNPSFGLIDDKKAIYHIEKYLSKNPPSIRYYNNEDEQNFYLQVADLVIRTNSFNSTCLENLTTRLEQQINKSYWELYDDKAFNKMQKLANLGSIVAKVKVKDIEQIALYDLVENATEPSNNKPGDLELKIADYIIERVINFENKEFDINKINPKYHEDAKQFYRTAIEKNNSYAKFKLEALLLYTGTEMEKAEANKYFVSETKNNYFKRTSYFDSTLYRKIVEPIKKKLDEEKRISIEKIMSLYKKSYEAYRKIDYKKSKEYFIETGQYFDNVNIYELDRDPTNYKLYSWVGFVYESGFFDKKEIDKVYEIYRLFDVYSPTFYNDFQNRRTLSEGMISNNLRLIQPEVKKIKDIRLRAIKGDLLGIFQNGISYLYETKQGGHNDITEGKYWIELAASKGYLPAQLFLLKNTHDENGHFPVSSEYDDLEKELTEKNIPLAMYYMGKNKPQKATASESKYYDTLVINAAKAGCVEALETWLSGRLNENNSEDQFNQIQTVLKQAVSNGNESTYLYLGNKYYSGDIKYRGKITKAPALQLWKKTADLGNSYSMLFLGCDAAYNKDYKTAVHWFKKLKTNVEKYGYSSGLDIWDCAYSVYDSVVDLLFIEMDYLGIEGKNNISDLKSKNSKLARFKAIANNGDPETEYLLCALYLKGVFVNSDFKHKEIEKWLDKARWHTDEFMIYQIKNSFFSRIVTNSDSTLKSYFANSNCWKFPENTNVYEESQYYVNAAKLKCKEPPPINQKPIS